MQSACSVGAVVMARAYLRLDPGFYERKVIDQGYPAGAALALIGALCHAEYQPTRGRFRSPAVLKTLLGPHAKWVQYLIEHKDLTIKKGQVYVDGWDEWQEGDWKVRERVQRIRNRQKATDEADDVTVAVTPGVTVAVTVATESDESVQTVTSRKAVGVIDSGGVSGGVTPQPPASGGRRANGDSPRQIAKAAAAEKAEADNAKRWRRSQRQLAYARGAISAEEQADMDRMDAPLAAIPDHEEHQAKLRAEREEAEAARWAG